MVLDFLVDTVDVEIFRRRSLENKMLRKPAAPVHPSLKREWLERFMAYRKDRMSIYDDASRSEFLSETHEGLAEYIGIRRWSRSHRTRRGPGSITTWRFWTDPGPDCLTCDG
jgi:hypothetical protein